MLLTTTWPDDIKQWPSEIKVITTTGSSVNLKKTVRKFQYVLDNNKWRRPKYGERKVEKIYYNCGSGRFIKILTIKDGKIIDIDDGDRGSGPVKCD